MVHEEKGWIPWYSSVTGNADSIYKDSISLTCHEQPLYSEDSFPDISNVVAYSETCFTHLCIQSKEP